MTPEQWSKVEALFLEAVEIPQERRKQFLDGACDGDHTLREEVEAMLASDAPDTPLIATPFLTEEPEDSREAPGSRIGPYRVVRLLGRGGMGSVLLAVRDDDHFKKEVAIKLLKRGMDTDAMLVRFRRERQILANLEHPFIARLLDGGATDDGLPYFVLEYVDGLPITKYCQGLGTDERLRVFRMVCEAVQYAHQNLVVHCDLKPGNILITREGIPKLLDFGIAKVMSPSQTGQPQTVTMREMRLMTPDYASPEQVLGLPSSTSMDIYALGAVLYEILTGQRAHQFESAALSEIDRTICEVEPERPSLAVRRGEGAYRIKEARSNQLRGDLDNIILTALRKDPQRRYSSVAEFSEDIRRHLDGLPVAAQEDRWSYRAGKFVRRHRLGVLAAGLLLASLIGGIAATTFQAKRAERRFELVRQIANSVIFDFYEEAHKLPGSTALQRSMIQTMVEYLDNLARDSGGDPELDYEMAVAYYRVAGVEGTPGQSNLGETSLALEHYQKAITIYERLVNNPQTRERAVLGLVDTHLEAIGVVEALGRPQEARAYLLKAKALVEDANARGEPRIHPGTQVQMYIRLANAGSSNGNIPEEQANARRAVELTEKWFSEEGSSLALEVLRSSYLTLAESLSHGGDFLAARDNFEKALKAGEQLGQRPDATFNQRFALVAIHHLYGDILGAPDDPNLGDPDGALKQYLAAVRIGEAIAAADPNDINPRRNLSGSYRRVGFVQIESNPAAALEAYRKSVKITEEQSANDPGNIQARSALAQSLLGEATALHNLHRDREALPILRRVLDLQRSIEQVDPDRIFFLRSTSRAYMVLGDVLMDGGDRGGAMEAYQAGLAAAERTLKRAPTSLYHMVDQGDLLEAFGKYHLKLAEGTPAARVELGRVAAGYFEKSVSIWQDWIKRKMAVPYAERRVRQASDLLAAARKL